LLHPCFGGEQATQYFRKLHRFGVTQINYAGLSVGCRRNVELGNERTQLRQFSGALGANQETVGSQIRNDGEAIAGHAARCLWYRDAGNGTATTARAGEARDQIREVERGGVLQGDHRDIA